MCPAVIKLKPCIGRSCAIRRSTWLLPCAVLLVSLSYWPHFHESYGGLIWSWIQCCSLFYATTGAELMCLVIKLALVRPVAQLGKLSSVCFLLQVCKCMDSKATVYRESIDQSTLSLFSLLEH